MLWPSRKALAVAVPALMLWTVGAAQAVTVQPVYSGGLTKVFVDAQPASDVVVTAGGLSRGTAEFVDPEWFVARSLPQVELFFRVDREAWVRSPECSAALSVAGEEVERSTATVVQGAGFAATFEGEGWGRLASVLGVHDTVVHVDCGASGSAQWPMPLTVLKASNPNAINGASINDGADFTNTTKVRVSLGWTGLMDRVRIPNDGGFAASKTREFDLTQDGPIPWELVELAAERIPRTVYVQYHAPLEGWQKQTYTDDIILDTVKPQILSATFSGADVASLAGPRTLRIKAKDNKSGLAAIQVSGGRPSKKAKVLKFKKSVPAPMTGRVFVRVRDGAGNWSSWRAAG